jgi:hypothetical protein
MARGTICNAHPMREQPLDSTNPIRECGEREPDAGGRAEAQTPAIASSTRFISPEAIANSTKALRLRPRACVLIDALSGIRTIYAAGS